jgi:hypothetical protein
VQGRLLASRRLAYSARYLQSRETPDFYVASASVLGVPRIRVSLRLCEVWPERQMGTLRLRKAFIHLSGGVSLLLRSKHERSNRWCLTTAVLSPALAVPVLVVATGFQDRDSTGLFGSTLTLTRRESAGVCDRSHVGATLRA